MGTIILGALFWTVLSGDTVTEEVDTGSGGEETATAGDAAAAMITNIQVKDEIQPNKTLFLLLLIVCTHNVVTVAIFRYL